MAGQFGAAPLRQRIGILATLLALSVAAWAVVVLQAMSTMGGAAMGLTQGMSVALFLGVWIAMMIAMMFPSAAPMILMFAAIATGKRRKELPYTPTWVFVCGYLLIWTLFGALAYALATGVDQLAMRSMWLMQNGARIGGVALVATGVYQLTPLKRVCLTKCRTPMQFILTSWHDGYRGALRMGMEHGAFCLGCCWWLMLALFPLGMMNIAALGSLTALIFAEKVLPVGRIVSVIAAAALIIYGAVVIFMPTALPGSM